MTTVASIPFGAQLIGRTEKALNAILERQLAGTGIAGPQWVALTLTVHSEGRLGADALAGKLSDALHTGPAAARVRLDRLIEGGLARLCPDGTVVATEPGREAWERVSAAAAEVGRRLWGDLPDADRATAAAVLNTVLERAAALLGGR